jgi:hypothetical protein
VFIQNYGFPRRSIINYSHKCLFVSPEEESTVETCSLNLKVLTSIYIYVLLDGLTIFNLVFNILSVVRRDFSRDIYGLMNPSHSNVDNMNNVRREAADISGTKRRHI